MYSYPERRQAVQLYIQSGKRIAAILRQLGYPTKNTPKSWYRDYQSCQDLCESAECSGEKYDFEQNR